MLLILQRIYGYAICVFQMVSHLPFKYEFLFNFLCTWRLIIGPSNTFTETAVYRSAVKTLLFSYTRLVFEKVSLGKILIFLEKNLTSAMTHCPSHPCLWRRLSATPQRPMQSRSAIWRPAITPKPKIRFSSLFCHRYTYPSLSL